VLVFAGEFQMSPCVEMPAEAGLNGFHLDLVYQLCPSLSLYCCAAGLTAPSDSFRSPNFWGSDRNTGVTVFVVFFSVLFFANHAMGLEMAAASPLVSVVTIWL
jgi:hypothetical protein